MWHKDTLIKPKPQIHQRTLTLSIYKSQDWGYFINKPHTHTHIYIYIYSTPSRGVVGKWFKSYTKYSTKPKRNKVLAKRIKTFSSTLESKRIPIIAFLWFSPNKSFSTYKRISLSCPIPNLCLLEMLIKVEQLHIPFYSI